MLKLTKNNFTLLSNQLLQLKVNVNQIATSDKFIHSDKCSKYFIGYGEDHDIIRPLCIVFSQMSGYMKYFDNGGKNMSFVIENDKVLVKYIEIWNKIKEEFDIKFYSEPVYAEKYIRTKVKRLMAQLVQFFAAIKF